MDAERWYNQLAKPDWAPDEKVFGQVWSLLYPIIIAANIYVVYLLRKKRITWRVALPFWLNLFFNLIFTPIQFGLKNNTLAALDIVLVIVTIIWAMYAITPYSKITASLFVPYLVWVGIATVLQFSIVFMN